MDSYLARHRRRIRAICSAIEWLQMGYSRKNSRPITSPDAGTDRVWHSCEGVRSWDERIAAEGLPASFLTNWSGFVNPGADSSVRLFRAFPGAHFPMSHRFGQMGTLPYALAIASGSSRQSFAQEDFENASSTSQHELRDAGMRGDVLWHRVFA